MNFRKRIGLILVFILLSNCIINFHIQSALCSITQKGMITGRVLENGSGSPIHFANVFLAGTTCGAATDEQGNYTIFNAPLGKQTLVVSMMGYITETIVITVKQGSQFVHNLICPRM